MQPVVKPPSLTWVLSLTLASGLCLNISLREELTTTLDHESHFQTSLTIQQFVTPIDLRRKGLPTATERDSVKVVEREQTLKSERNS